MMVVGVDYLACWGYGLEDGIRRGVLLLMEETGSRKAAPCGEAVNCYGGISMW